MLGPSSSLQTHPKSMDSGDKSRRWLSTSHRHRFIPRPYKMCSGTPPHPPPPSTSTHITPRHQAWWDAVLTVPPWAELFHSPTAELVGLEYRLSPAMFYVGCWWVWLSESSATTGFLSRCRHGAADHVGRALWCSDSRCGGPSRVRHGLGIVLRQPFWGIRLHWVESWIPVMAPPWAAPCAAASAGGGRKHMCHWIGAEGQDMAWIPLHDSGRWSIDRDPRVAIESQVIKSGSLLGDLTVAVEYRFGLMPNLIWPSILDRTARILAYPFDQG
jgi:hypothetical protein